MKHKYLILLFVLVMLSCSKKQEYIVAIGDSNGAHENGWVAQLRKIRSNDSIINYSISGNTIGFDNLNKNELNTLKNINSYLTNARNTLPKIDKIIVILGTNDCKAVFDTLLTKVVVNLDSLISHINKFEYASKKPDIILCSPPPAGADSVLIEKYKGINNRLTYLHSHYERIAEKHNCIFLDLYTQLVSGFDTLNIDGIHLNETGYIEIAKLINTKLL